MWHPDVSAEQLLNEIGIPFVVKTAFPIKQLKIKESLSNNARSVDPLDQDRVEKYAFDMAKGQSFPRPVITPDGMILAGNQRVNAAVKANRTTVDVYVIQSKDDALIQDFIRRDNTRHGKPTTDEDRINACVYLHRRFGTAIRTLCEQYFGNNQRMYQRIISANSARTVIDRLLSKHVLAKLPTTSLASMYQIPDDNVLVDTYKLSADFGLSGQQIDQLVSDICKHGSESERKAVVRAKREELEARVKTGVVSPEVVLKKCLTSFSKNLSTGFNGAEFPQIDTLDLDKKQLTELKSMIDDAIMKLKKLKEKTHGHGRK